MSTATSEMDNLKARLKGTWSAGDFGQIARSYETGAAEFVSRLSIQPGQRVLDVACGTGNLAFPAARTGAAVVGVDIAPNMVEQARQRARNENLSIRFDEGDVEQLPYDKAGFDVAMSMFGAMFAPRPELVTKELLRVTRPGGVIAMANWTAEGFVGQIFKVIAGFVPPPAIMPSPLLWGNEAKLRERFGAGIAELQVRPLMITLDFEGKTVAEVVEFWRQYYGPTQRAFEAVAADPAKEAGLRSALEQLWAAHNRALAGSTRVESEYMDVRAVRA